jgi:hypothetical protein
LNNKHLFRRKNATIKPVRTYNAKIACQAFWIEHDLKIACSKFPLELKFTKIHPFCFTYRNAHHKSAVIAFNFNAITLPSLVQFSLT